MNLPKDYIEFLSGSRRLDSDLSQTETGNISFLEKKDLKVDAETFYVDLFNLDHPNVTDKMKLVESFSVTGVSLLASCENFDPYGLFLWFPERLSFGTWDSDHHTVGEFPSTVSWTTIASDPERYLNAFWGDDEESSTGFRLILPGANYET